jgi:hypothetical protein
MFHTLTGSATYQGLTSDSNRSDQTDVDWYKVRFATVPTTGDIIRVHARNK